MRWSWSSLEGLDASGRDDVNLLYDSPDFYYRTVTPTMLDSVGLARLLSEGTRVVRIDGAVAGLCEVAELDPFSWTSSGTTGIYQLHYRLRGDLAAETWVEGLGHIVDYLAGKSRLLRVAWHLPEFDEMGIAVAVASGFVREGTIGDTLFFRGGSCGTAVMARTWSMA